MLNINQKIIKENSLFLNENLFITKKINTCDSRNFALVNIKKNRILGEALIQTKNTGNPDIDYKRYPLCTFTNPSDNPNLTLKIENNIYYFIANKNIKKNEELTIDYREFDFEGERGFIQESKTEDLEAVKSIISSISEKEEDYLGPRWFYYNSQYRYIYIKDNKPVGFIEGRIIKNKCHLNACVSQDYRNQGIFTLLIKKALKEIPDSFNINSMVWRVNKENKISIKKAKEFKFKENTKLNDDEMLVFELQIERK
jgi:RimJ/RimL family protein N-acetyltransferase